MANKSIILSSGDGKPAFSNTASVYIDDADDSLNADNIIIDSLKINSLPSGEQLLKINNGNIEAIGAAAIDRSALLWNGTQWVSSSLTYAKYSGSAGGDLRGEFPNPEVINISNVDSGVLPVERGGTGLSIPANSYKVYKAHNNVISSTDYSGSSYDNKPLINKDGEWNFQFPSYLPDIRFYTASASDVGSTNKDAGVSSVYTWYKPVGKTYMRVIAQAAGGGGSSGHTFGNTPTLCHQGSGGGSGGFTDKVYSLSNVPDVCTVYVGVGGKGGPGNPVTGDNVWYGTGTSDGIVGTAVGGGGGGSGLYGTSWIALANPGGGANYGWIAAGAGGAGSTFNGTAGGYGGGSSTGADGVASFNNSSGGGSGDRFGSTTRFGGTVTSTGLNSISDPVNTRNFDYLTDSLGNSITMGTSRGAAGAFWINSTANKPAKPLYGAGGGGGAAYGGEGQSGGGDGGDGYVLIICW